MRKAKVLGIIPARLKSTRLPKKMLAQINGKPLLWHTWQRAKKARLPDEVIIATDSNEIRMAMTSLGATVVMTSVRHQSGSDRVAEAARKFKEFKPDIIVNIQGDEPILNYKAVDAAASVLIKEKRASAGTVLVPFKSEKDLKKPSIVKIVIDNNNFMLYASRSVIPYPRNHQLLKDYYKQLGIYSFRFDSLQKYIKLPMSPLEKTEGLEQIRMLQNDMKIIVSIGEFDSISVDVPSDLTRVRKIMSGKKHQ
jgi:3-deoxy-manno-octulosonate cytidylyltransferase (CMP-KDO synthetase)